MSSPQKREKSGSPSREKGGKRMPDLVSTRRDFFPENYNSRGRSRPFGRRPYINRRARGRPFFRTYSNRYYNNYQRQNSRDSYGRKYSNYHRRSRSRSHGHQKSRSLSPISGRGSKRYHSSSSSSSSSRSALGSQQRPRKSKSSDNHASRKTVKKNVKLSHLRNEGSYSQSSDSESPERKKIRQAPVESKDKSQRSKEKVRSAKKKKGIGRQKQQSSSEENDFKNQKSSQGKSHSDDSNSSQYNKQSEEKRDKIKKVNKRAKEQKVSPSTPSRKKSSTETVKLAIPRNKLHKIFTMISNDQPFELKEDISIAIQRNPYAEPSEESTVKKTFDAELFCMIRGSFEGRSAIFDREEIKIFGHDNNLADDPDFEKRVVRIKSGKSLQSAETSSSQHLESSRILTGMMVERERKSSESRSSSSPVHKEPQFRLKLLTDPQYEARYFEMMEQGQSSRMFKLDPNDLRHTMHTNKRKSSSDLRNRPDYDKREERQRISGKGRILSREEKQEVKRAGESLPDFSNRKGELDWTGSQKQSQTLNEEREDKYQYAEWMDKPEMIPKNPSYFIHDNREGWMSRDRGHGRGFRGRFTRPFRPFRGQRGYLRGSSFRGNSRGRGHLIENYSQSSHDFSSSHKSSRSSEREWKHDKFAEMEGDKSHRDDEQRPHSTSER